MYWWESRSRRCLKANHWRWNQRCRCPSSIGNVRCKRDQCTGSFTIRIHYKHPIRSHCFCKILSACNRERRWFYRKVKRHRCCWSWYEGHGPRARKVWKCWNQENPRWNPSSHFCCQGSWEKESQKRAGNHGCRELMRSRPTRNTSSKECTLRGWIQRRARIDSSPD